MKHTLHTKYHSGAAVLITVVLCLLISLTVVLGIATPILKQVKASTDTVKSKESYYLAEAGIEDALYRLKTNKQISSGETIVVNGYTTTVSITTNGNVKTITAESDRQDIIRKMEAKVTASDGVAFNYAMQAGNGGFSLSGGSIITGNVYANGNIVGDSGSITGSATAANSAPLTASFSNTCPTTPTSQINFSGSNAVQDFAQKFQVDTDSVLNKARFYIKRTSTAPGGTFTVRITTDNAGKPATSALESVVVAQSSFPTTFNGAWTEVLFANYIPLNAGQTYWLVLDSSNSSNASRYYTIGANSAFASYEGKTGQYTTTTWAVTSPTGLDGCSEVYSGGITSTIRGLDGSWDLAIGTSSWAHTINNTNTGGTLYCQAGTGNASGKVCNTSRPDPSAQSFPITENQIQAWKDGVSTFDTGWVYTGNLTIGYQGTTSAVKKVVGNLTINGGGVAIFNNPIEVTGNVTITGGGQLTAGPMKVNGNLAVSSTGFTMTGNIWTVGTVTINSGGNLRVHSSLSNDSSIIISDNRVDITGGGSFTGSGTPGSFPIILTTSDCPNNPSCGGSNAMSLSGGAGAIVLYAPNGTLNLNGGSAATAMTAYKVLITGGGRVTYDEGLVDLSLSTGPSGSWNVTSWKEVQ